MSTANSSIRDVLYEPPGPRTRRRIRIATAVSIVVIAVLAAKVVRRFYIAGQLGPKYWSLLPDIPHGGFWDAVWRGRWR